jgi:hypothetical protein
VGANPSDYHELWHSFGDHTTGDGGMLIVNGNVAPDVVNGDLVVCRRCGQARTIEHHGGRWCTNCGCFASPPDPNLLPSNQPGYREPHAGSVRGPYAHERRYSASLVCGWCDQPGDMDGGIYDDGEWMCASCIARYAR